MNQEDYILREIEKLGTVVKKAIKKEPVQEEVAKLGQYSSVVLSQADVLKKTDEDAKGEKE